MNITNLTKQSEFKTAFRFYKILEVLFVILCLLMSTLAGNWGDRILGFLGGVFALSLLNVVISLWIYFVQRAKTIWPQSIFLTLLAPLVFVTLSIIYSYKTRELAHDLSDSAMDILYSMCISAFLAIDFVAFFYCLKSVLRNKE